MSDPHDTLAHLSGLTLDQLAARISALYAGAVTAAAKSALALGLLLIDAQLQTQLGNLSWQAWVKDNLPFGVRQANSYLRFAKDAQLNKKRASDITDADLRNVSLRAGLRLLASSSAPERDPDQPASTLATNVVRLRPGASEAKAEPEGEEERAPSPEPSAAGSSDLRHPGAVIGAMRAFGKLNLDQRRRYLTQLVRKLSPNERQRLVEELARLN